jgi:hypothetical protein
MYLARRRRQHAKYSRKRRILRRLEEGATLQDLADERGVSNQAIQGLVARPPQKTRKRRLSYGLSNPAATLATKKKKAEKGAT